MRPYYKFTVPAVDIAQEEREIWEQLMDGSLLAGEAIDALAKVYFAGSFTGLFLFAQNVVLTNMPQLLLPIPVTSALPSNTPAAITCLTRLNYCDEGEHETSCVVLGTESRDVILLSPPGNVIAKLSLPSVPVLMATYGLLDVEWRVVVACRNGKIYTVKNGDNFLGASLEQTRSPPGSVSPCRTFTKFKTSFGVVCMPKPAFLFTTAATFLVHFVQLRGPVADLAPMPQTRSPTLLVALTTGEVCLFNGKSLLNVLNIGEVISGIAFGSFARSDTALLVVCSSGAIHIKMLSRKANLDTIDTKPGPPPEQDVPLPIPKKTRLYVDLAQRERDLGSDMHRVFQRDSCKLRLQTAKAYGSWRELIHSSTLPTSFIGAGDTIIHLHAECKGLGPQFSIELGIQNGGAKALCRLLVTFAYSRDMYSMARPQILIPILMPGVLTAVEAPITCIDPAAITTDRPVQIILLEESKTAPLVGATLRMPPSELDDD
ncbi:unnamed protein product [Chrysoparadoxa australica]